MVSAHVVDSDEGSAQGAARLVRWNDVRHLIPALHRRPRLHREEAPRSAVSGRREGTPARTRRSTARRAQQLRRIRPQVGSLVTVLCK